MNSVISFCSANGEIAFMFFAMIIIFFGMSIKRGVDNEYHHNFITKAGPAIQAIIGLVVLYIVLQFTPQGKLTETGEELVGLTVLGYFIVGYWIWDFDWF